MTEQMMQMQAQMFQGQPHASKPQPPEAIASEIRVQLQHQPVSATAKAPELD